MQHRDDKLHFLLHAFRELLDGSIPPTCYVELVKPSHQSFFGLTTVESLESGKVYGLLSDLHLFVKTSLFWQITYLLDISVGHRMPIHEDCAVVGKTYPVDKTYECGFAGSIGTQETEDGTLANVDIDIVERSEGAEILFYVLCFEEQGDF